MPSFLFTLPELLLLTNLLRASMLSLQAALYASIIVYIASIYTVLSIARVSFIPHLHSEWLCWCILWLISKIAQDTKGAVYNDATIRPDKLAMAIAAVCLFSSIGRVYWALVRAHH